MEVQFLTIKKKQSTEERKKQGYLRLTISLSFSLSFIFPLILSLSLLRARDYKVGKRLLNRKNSSVWKSILRSSMFIWIQILLKELNETSCALYMKMCLKYMVLFLKWYLWEKPFYANFILKQNKSKSNIFDNTWLSI